MHGITALAGEGPVCSLADMALKICTLNIKGLLKVSPEGVEGQLRQGTQRSGAGELFSGTQNALVRPARHECMGQT